MTRTAYCLENESRLALLLFFAVMEKIMRRFYYGAAVEKL